MKDEKTTKIPVTTLYNLVLALPWPEEEGQMRKSNGITLHAVLIDGHLEWCVEVKSYG